MPESKASKSAADQELAAERKKKVSREAAPKKTKAGLKTTSDKKGQAASPSDRSWVVPTFLTFGLLGVAWLVVFYVTSSTGISIPFMAPLGGWNILIGMGLMAAAFAIAMLWK